MKKRVFASVILSILGILSLGGCLGGNKSENKDSQESKVIEIWISDAVKFGRKDSEARCITSGHSVFAASFLCLSMWPPFGSLALLLSSPWP